MMPNDSGPTIAIERDIPNAAVNLSITHDGAERRYSLTAEDAHKLSEKLTEEADSVQTRQDLKRWRAESDAKKKAKVAK